MLGEGGEEETSDLEEFPDLPDIPGSVEEETEVIVGGGALANREAVAPVDDFDDSDNLEFEDELAPIPETPNPTRPTVAETSIPDRRQKEYRVPELISGVGSRARSPGGTSERKVLKFDKSRIASTSDERLAADPEAEEGAVTAHVARKITGWGLDEDELADGTASTAGGSTLKSRVAVAGIVSVVVIFIGLIVYGVMQSLRDKEVVAREEVKSITELALEELGGAELDVIERSEETFAAAGEVITNYLNAENYNDRLAFVRDSARVGPLMKRHYEKITDEPFKFRKPEDGWKLQPYGSFLLTSVTSENFSESPIAVERQEDGSYLVDWESFVGYCEIPWDEITETKSLEPFLLRARASIGDYFNYGYTEAEWVCVQLQDAMQKHTIYGYLKHDDPVFDELREVMPSGAAHVTVRVAYPPGGKASNQFIITDVVSKGWVFSDALKDGDGE